MSRRRATLCVASWIFLAGVSAGAADEGSSDSKTDPVETVYGQPIDNGFVIFHGQYLPPPYVVGRRGGTVLVNDHLIPDKSLTGRSRGRGRGPRGRGGGHGGQQGAPDRQSFALARVERQLDEDGMLIVLEDGPAGFIRSADPVSILDILLSDAESEAKVQSLMDQEVPWISSADWGRVVDKFEPTPELAERVRTIVDGYESMVAGSHGSHAQSEWRGFLSSKPVSYGMTATAMLLAVIATGTLLTHRPTSGVRWRERDRDGDGIGMVVRNVVLLCLLGGLDFLLTLAAQQAGGFLELNPLGAKLIESPMLLCTFKMTVFAAACGILIILRRYRGAQIASWWLCLVCTIVTFRWLTYNSLFLG